MELLQAVMVLPFFTCSVWLKHSVMQKEAAWIHAASGVVPIAFRITDGYIRSGVIDNIQTFNAVSLAVVVIMNNDFYAFGACALISLAYFNFNSDGNCFRLNCRDMYNFALSGFAYCALLAASPAPAPAT